MSLIQCAHFSSILYLRLGADDMKKASRVQSFIASAAQMDSAVGKWKGVPPNTFFATLLEKRLNGKSH